MNFAPQFLKHGLALCGKNFPRVVETWNWLSDFCVNLKGDADVNADSGSIKVDRTNPAHPVIRFVGSAGDGSGDGSSMPSAFQATAIYDGDTFKEWQITNWYLMRGGIIYYESNGVVGLTVVAGNFICANVNLGFTGGVTVEVVANLDALKELQRKESNYYVPLYYATAPKELVDLRTMPQVQLFEVGLTSDDDE